MIETLVGVARDVALQMAKDFPEMRITSARRTVLEQAQKMATNVVLNRSWIRETYALARAATECQAWADIHPKAPYAELTEAFARIIEAMDEHARRQLSRHITGEAFDILPVGGARGEKMREALQEWARKKSGKFLDREGGLTIWHWQAP